jgi:hypothetical protein
VIGVVRIDLQLPSQPSDVHIQRLGVTEVLRAPHLGDEVVARSQPAHSGEERPQKVELLWRNGNVFTAHTDLVTAPIELDRAAAQDFDIRLARDHRGAPAMRTHA